MNIRERIEQNEALTLIPQASHSKDSKGRERMEPADDFRTCYMIDRDRIIHSKSFRRLKHKTQVYIRTGDHYRTRLTHTLEVSQVARTIARGLALNEDLVEAITLGHDLGHVAFAHNGEDILNQLLPGGFRHYEQSVRVLRRLERDGRGLNLTVEVLEGIEKHSGFGSLKSSGTSMEAQIAKVADKIAYVNHDIDDSIRAGMLQTEDLPAEFVDVLGPTHSLRIDTLVRDCVRATEENLSSSLSQIALSPQVEKALMGLRRFMFENIYLGAAQKKEKDKAQFIITHLFAHFLAHGEEMPELYQTIQVEEGIERAVADYIAGMTDEFATALFQRIFIPGFTG